MVMRGKFAIGFPHHKQSHVEHEPVQEPSALAKYLFQRKVLP